MNTSIRAGKTISTKELKVIAHFSNGFAETVYELSDGTVLFISYHNDRIRIVERELIPEIKTCVYCGEVATHTITADGGTEKPFCTKHFNSAVRQLSR